nr:MAG: hypothetical protein BECKUNK1418H_GA0071006_10552 [Candidatus Kentron sp. UNK]
MALFLVFRGNTLALARELVVASEDSIRRWRAWLAERTGTFEFHLRSVLPDLGRHSQGEDFWASALTTLGLREAMSTVCRQKVVVP